MVSLKKYLSYQLLLWPLVCLLPSCSWDKDDKPSVLVIAVEGLGFDSISCGKEGQIYEGAGFNTFCQESVRFTHAYSPSLLSQPTLTSILTAKYPLEHKVVHNGSNFLNPRTPIIAQEALKLGYRTSFFSGGPPIWSKSGLNRGFETFYDHYQIALNKYYKPSLENIDTFLSWMDNESDKTPFFSFIFLPDLQFPFQTTQNNNGEIREKSYQSQKSEISESIDYLIKQLKYRNRWDNAYIILVGLNGKSLDTTEDQLPPLDVSSEATRVALYIKPPRKQRDLPIQWKIDSNISLVDLGVSLFDFISATPPLTNDSNLELTSLAPVLNAPDVNWNEDRLIPLESGWPLWRELGNIKYSIRKGNYIISLGKETKVYNTLTDRFEKVPITKTDPLWSELSDEARAFAESQEIPPWAPPDHSSIEKLVLAKRIFQKNVDGRSISKTIELSKKLYWDDQVRGWAARLLIHAENYKYLDKFGKQHHKPLWRYVAKRNLGKSVRPPKKGCGKYFSANQVNFKRPQPKECDDIQFIRLLAWTLAKTQPLRDKAFEEFWRDYKPDLLKKVISIENYRVNLNWDVDLSAIGEPSLIELYLSLPKNKPFKNTLQARISKHLDQGTIY